MLIYEEGHNFAPSGQAAVSHRIIRKIAGEGRKFGVGFGIVSQRPSKLDPDVTSQCNTLIIMRLKNPDDQRFISRTSDMISQAELDELPSLSTGEALVFGRSITAPLLVKVGTKTLIHGGQSPNVLAFGGDNVSESILDGIRSEVESLNAARETCRFGLSRDCRIIRARFTVPVLRIGTSSDDRLGFLPLASCPLRRRARWRSSEAT